jgi:hypothetical protein
MKVPFGLTAEELIKHISENPGAEFEYLTMDEQKQIEHKDGKPIIAQIWEEVGEY